MAHVTKIKVAGSLRVALPDTAVILETGYVAWNVPATFVTDVPEGVARSSFGKNA